MSVDRTVKLCPSGGSDYWYARYYTNQGKRRRVVVGRKDELSKRAAEKKCGELAEKLAKEPSRRDVMECPKLGPWLDHYLKLRTDLKPASMVWHKLVVTRLKECFGEETRIDKITRADAADFQAKASKFKKTGGDIISDFTAHKYVVVAREIFGHAFRQDATPINPFDRLRISTPTVEKTWPYITHDDTDKIIEACPDHGWRCMIALARWAGLRRGEAQRLTWADVDWDGLLLTVLPPGGRRDTKNRLRTVPIQARLHAVLRAAYEAAPEKVAIVCDVRSNGVEKRIRSIVKRAGLPPLNDKPLHTLRKNLESDWLAEHPVLDVTGWLGNSPDVASKHYNKTTAETVAKVTGGKSKDQQIAALLAEIEKLKAQEVKA